jgi:hypothetical protein
MRVSPPVLMIVAAMIAGPVRAEFVTGNDLYSKCNSNAPEDKFWCLGFVTGVADTLPQGSKGIECPGPNVTAGQFYDVVVKDRPRSPGDARPSSIIPRRGGSRDGVSLQAVMCDAEYREAAGAFCARSGFSRNHLL